jgi:hypothetical protein
MTSTELAGHVAARPAKTVTQILARVCTGDSRVAPQSGRDADGRRIGIPATYLVVK